MNIRSQGSNYIAAHHGVALVTVKPPSHSPSILPSGLFISHALIMGAQVQCQQHVFAAERMLPIMMAITCRLVSYHQLDLSSFIAVLKNHVQSLWESIGNILEHIA